MEKPDPQKRIFVELLLVTCLILSGVVAILWLVPYIGLAGIHPSAPLILAMVFGIFLLFIFMGVALLVVTIARGKDIFLSHKLRGLVIQVLFPFIVAVGKLL